MGIQIHCHEGNFGGRISRRGAKAQCLCFVFKIAEERLCNNGFIFLAITLLLKYFGNKVIASVSQVFNFVQFLAWGNIGGTREIAISRT